MAASKTADVRVVRRAKIVLAAAEGLSSSGISRLLQVKSKTVFVWLARFREEGMDCLKTGNCPVGRKPRVRLRETDRILHATFHETPANRRQWTCRTLAAHLKITTSLVQRVWNLNGVTEAVRRDYFLPPPFGARDQKRLIGGYFCGNDQAIVVEVFEHAGGAQVAEAQVADARVERAPAADCEPLFVSTSLSFHDATVQGNPKLLQLHIEQQAAFLKAAKARAKAKSRIKLITSGVHVFSHPRLRRWLCRQGRISVHCSASMQEYLAEAECELRARFPRGRAPQEFMKSAAAERATQRVGRALSVGGSIDPTFVIPRVNGKAKSRAAAL